jgi:hypothetical protein
VPPLEKKFFSPFRISMEQKRVEKQHDSSMEEPSFQDINAKMGTSKQERTKKRDKLLQLLFEQQE